MTQQRAFDLLIEDRPIHDAGAPPKASSFLILCVNHGSDKETRTYLDCLGNLQMQSSLSVIVVDNTPREPDDAPSLPQRERVTVLRPPENLGYLGGARYGLAHYLRDHEMPDWVVISNVDLILNDPEFLNRLSNQSQPGVAAIAPSIRSLLTGHDQNPCMRHRPSSLRMHLYKWFFRSRALLNMAEALAALLKRVRGMSGGQPGRAEPLRRINDTIYAPHGSFLILKKEYFTRGGDLEFPGFLFGEEIYLAETFRRLGLRVVYRPELEVFHQEHRSTRLFKSAKLAADVAFSAAYCADTFFPLGIRAGRQQPAHR